MDRLLQAHRIARLIRTAPHHSRTGHQAMRSSADEYRFRDRFIAVVDILGFSRKVKATEQGDSDVTLSDLLSYGRALAQKAHVQMIT